MHVKKKKKIKFKIIADHFNNIQPGFFLHNPPCTQE